MNDGLRWIFEAYPLGYSIIFCEHLTPEEVLVRLGARPESLFPLTSGEAEAIEVRNSMEEPADLYGLDDLDEDALEALGFLRPEADAIVRAGSIGGWSFAIQASTSYVSARAYLPALSQDTRVVAASRDANATQRVEYAVDGRILSSFDPLFPADDIGADPSALTWPTAERMNSPEVLEQLKARFGLWVPRNSEDQRLPAAALSSR